MKIELNQRVFELLVEKAIYDAANGLLIIADVHLGKAAHFRKEGIAIPAAVQEKDYHRLAELFTKLKPERVYFLGDLFHSTVNKDWFSFCALVRDFPAISFTLIKGNHDLVEEKLFTELCIAVEDIIEDRQFVFSHHPLTQVADGKINLCGHIHPGVALNTGSRQSITLPCFYHYQQTMILPAFGVLTGLYKIRRKKGDEVYGILPEKVQKLS